MIALILPPMFAAAGYSLIYLLGGGGLVGAIVIFVVAKCSVNKPTRSGQRADGRVRLRPGCILLNCDPTGVRPRISKKELN